MGKELLLEIFKHFRLKTFLICWASLLCPTHDLQGKYGVINIIYNSRFKVSRLGGHSVFSKQTSTINLKGSSSKQIYEVESQVVIKNIYIAGQSIAFNGERKRL